MAAAEAALAAGLGIECDVRLSRDDTPFLFHDEGLERLAGVRGLLSDQDAEALDRLGVARLETLLSRVAGAQPLLVEIKASAMEARAASRAVHRALAAYRGAVAVMSFNPLVSAWFARRTPERARGLVLSAQGKPLWRHQIEGALALRIARPDFLAYDIRDLPDIFAARQRARGMPVIGWTVESPGGERALQPHVDALIIEGSARG